MLNDWTAETADEDDGALLRRRDVYEHVYNRVIAETDAEVYMIPVGEIVYQLALAIEAGEIDGLSEYSSLYRDDLHLGYGVGRHVASATTFSTLYGDDLSDISFGNLSSAANASINALIWDEISSNSFTGVPEPGVGLSVLLLTALMGGRSRGVGRSLNH